MSKTHYFDLDNELKIPREHRYKDYKSSKCGYQRKNTATDKNEVTCKLCLKEIGK